RVLEAGLPHLSRERREPRAARGLRIPRRRRLRAARQARRRMARLRDRREAAGPMTRLALLLVSVAALAAPALGAAQETTKDAQEAEPESPARAGLERRQTLPPPGPIPPAFSVNGALRGGVQWIVNPARAKDDVFGFGAFDLVLTGRPTPNVTLLADVAADQSGRLALCVWRPRAGRRRRRPLRAAVRHRRAGPSSHLFVRRALPLVGARRLCPRAPRRRHLGHGHQRRSARRRRHRRV